MGPADEIFQAIHGLLEICLAGGMVDDVDDVDGQQKHGENMMNI